MLLKKHIKQQGFVTILVAVMIVLLATVITFITARNVVNDQHMFRNTYYTAKAHSLAQGGFFYGLAYLNNKFSTVTDNTILTNANDSQLPPNLSIAYTYIGGNNKQMQIQSTGNVVEPSGTVSTGVVKGVAKRLVSQSVTQPVFSVSNVTMDNNAKITNLENNITVVSGQTVILNNNSRTVLSTGTSSTSGNIQSDILQNQTDAQISQTELQQNILGLLVTDFDSSQIRTMRLPASGYYTSTTAFDSQLNGVTGETIYIDMGGTNIARLATSNTVIGSSDQPVTIVVNGKASIESNVTINGNLYATGDIALESNSIIRGLVFTLGAFKIESNAIVYGGVVAYGGITMKGNSQLIYNSPNLISSGGGAMGYGLVPGSWRDF